MFEGSKHFSEEEKKKNKKITEGGRTGPQEKVEFGELPVGIQW